MDGLQDSLQKIQLFFPSGCFALFQVGLTLHRSAEIETSFMCITLTVFGAVRHAVCSNTDNHEWRMRRPAGKRSESSHVQHFLYLSAEHTSPPTRI